ncbi:MAG: glycosyltransferase [Lachnospiraceae bacterium]|nr:glycosyltransferase [Lachnospiraceae bacterium]
MRLSVIVPVYNMAAEGKLKFCMDSLVNQTTKDYEIIAVDDASTDGSLEILRAYQERYPGKVRVITYPVNRRQGGAKNEGLRAASGEWIGFVDSDDWVTPDYYERLLAKAEETGADMVGCDYTMVSKQGFEPGETVENNTADQTGPLDQEKHRKLLLRPGSMVVKIYRRSVIQENGLSFPEGIFYEDNCAGALWSLYFTRFERVDAPLYYYYQHDASTVHRITPERCRDRMRAEEIFYEECGRRGFLERYGAEIEYCYTLLYYVVTLFSYLQGVRNPKLSFVRELRRGVTKRWPQFWENPYYKERVGEEEQRLIALQRKSDPGFYWYYRLKRLARSLRKSLTKKTLFCGLGALLGFGLLFGATFQGRGQRGRQVTDIVVFGDSVFTDIGGMEAIPDRLAQALDMSVYNASMGGTCASRLEKERRQDSATGSMSLAGLAKAVRGMDFTVQQTAGLRESNTEPFPGIIAGLAEIDFSRVEMVLIGKGLNDYHGGAVIDNPLDPYDEYSFLGAIRSAVKDLRERNPDVRIVLVTPAYAWYTAQGVTCEEIEYGGGFLEDYVNAELGLARELGVEAVDLYHDFYPHEREEDWELYTADGLHPNEAGREKIVQKIIDTLKPGDNR